MPRALDSSDLASRCAGIRLLVLDVDGVLTDGAIILDDLGVESKHFHVRDGAAIALWLKSGRRVAILSGRESACVARRALELGISPVIQGVGSKIGPFSSLLKDLHVAPESTCYVGDDWADLPVLDVVGLAACPSDAAEEVLAASHLVAKSRGGRGAVREVIEVILKEQGDYESLVAAYRPTG